MSTKVALSGAERKKALLVAAVKLAGKHGSSNITRRMLAAEAKVSESLISLYFETTDKLRKAAKAAAKKAGVAEPSKEQQEAIGRKLRAHGPRDKRDTRKRSAREVEAIKRKAGAAKKSPAKSAATPKRARSDGKAAKKSAGRAATKASAGAATRERKPTGPRETKPTAPQRAPQRRSPESKPTAPAERKSAARKPLPPPSVGLPDALPGETVGLPDNLVGRLN